MSQFVSCTVQRQSPVTFCEWISVTVKLCVLVKVVNNYTNAEIAVMHFTYKGHEVLTVVIMKRTISWDIMSCCLFKVN